MALRRTHGFSSPCPTPTRLLALKESDEIERKTEFIIIYLGFLMGVRLVPDGWRNQTRTPLKPHTLVDFRCSTAALERMLDKADQLWRRLPDALSRKRLFAAIHWWLLAGCFHEEYQSFAAHYTALDACWNVWCATKGINPRKDTHSTRPGILCDALGVPIPSWAESPQAGASPLANVRNQLLHEGLYGGEPVGFSYPTGDQEFDLGWLVSRLLVALISGSNNYTNSQFSRQVRFIES